MATSATPEEECDSYQEWLAERDQLLQVLRRRKMPVGLVRVPADAHLAWLAARGLPNLPRHRAEFAAERMAAGRADG